MTESEARYARIPHRRSVVRSIATGAMAALLAASLLLVPGRPQADTFCLDMPGGETIRGYFVTPERKTRLHLFTKPSDGGCRLRHDGGPASEANPSTEYAEFAGVCRDPVLYRT